MTLEAFAIQSNTATAEVLRRATNAGVIARGSTIGSFAGGIVATGDLQVSAVTGELKVSVAAGEAFVAQTQGSSGGAYYVRSPGAVNSQTAEQVTVAAANATNPRVDLVVVRVKDSTYSGSVNSAVLETVTGTATAGATLANRTGAPAAPATSLVLAYVLVPAKATSVVSGNIENVAKVAQPGLQRSETALYSQRPEPGVRGRMFYATDGAQWYVDTGTEWRAIQQYVEGAASSRPSAGDAGRLYYATDSKSVSRDTGESWSALSPSSVAAASAYLRTGRTNQYGAKSLTAIQHWTMTLTTPHAISRPYVLLSLLASFYKKEGEELSGGLTEEQAYLKVYVNGTVIKMPTGPTTESARSQYFASVLALSTILCPIGTRAFVWPSGMNVNQTGALETIELAPAVHNDVGRESLAAAEWSQAATIGNPQVISVGSSVAAKGSVTVEIEAWQDAYKSSNEKVNNPPFEAVLGQLEAAAVLIG
jgi:hypothetical protein